MPKQQLATLILLGILELFLQIRYQKAGLIIHGEHDFVSIDIDIDSLESRFSNIIGCMCCGPWKKIPDQIRTLVGLMVEAHERSSGIDVQPARELYYPCQAPAGAVRIR